MKAEIEKAEELIKKKYHQGKKSWFMSKNARKIIDESSNRMLIMC